MDRTTRARVLDNLALLLVSMTMVVGFWVHGEFYQFGLGPLVLVGGLVTFTVLKVILWSGSTMRLQRYRTQGTLLFHPDEVAAVLEGRQRAVARPLRRSHLVAGSLVAARSALDSPEPFATLRILETDRVPLSALPAAVARECGAGEPPDLQRWLGQAYGIGHGDIVRVLRFSVIAPRR